MSAKTIIKSTRIRGGLYEVLLSNGKCYAVESFDPAWWDDVESDHCWRITRREWLNLGDGLKWYDSDEGVIRELNTKKECMDWLKVYG